MFETLNVLERGWIELNISNTKSENLVVCALKYKKVISSHCNLLSYLSN